MVESVTKPCRKEEFTNRESLSATSNVPVGVLIDLSSGVEADDVSARGSPSSRETCVDGVGAATQGSDQAVYSPGRMAVDKQEIVGSVRGTVTYPGTTITMVEYRNQSDSNFFQRTVERGKPGSATFDNSVQK